MTLKHWPFVLVLLLATACGSQRLDVIPTQADINALATAQIQTRNAPPEGWRDAVSFPRIDEGLSSLPGWRYVVHMEFEGEFDGTPREVTAVADAEVWYNQVASARRVVFTTEGDLFGREEDENTAYEAVRLGPDAFLIQDGTCMTNVGDDAMTAATLGAGDLLGGVTEALPFGRQATLNGEDAWLYAFEQDDLNLPTIEIAEGGSMAMTGELWVAPEHGAVVRYYLTLDVTRARLFGRTLPVNGRVIMRYDVFDIGQAFNITQPFGC